MASSSTVPIHKSFTYDVFLSFRGEDTRANFINHLYNALQQQNIYVYKDDEAIRKGKKISDELSRCIEDSRFYIIVFSKNYASSSWCLDELVRIMECHKTNGHTAYPVFYDVEPTEVRKQSGAVGEAFSKHENDEAAGKWKEALKEAADLAGWEMKNTTNGHEAKLIIQMIVGEISLQLRSIDFNVDEKLVGMETRVKDVVSSLETCTDDVRIIGIKGMGSGGKTTLAGAIFDQISFKFEGKIFVENVREVSKASLSGLTSLQNKVLSHVLNDQNINVRSVYEGKNMMKRRMCGGKLLVVLDDVDDIEQLEALAGEPDWFKPGSTIIITTRDEQVLLAHRVKLIFDVNLLSRKEALSLFSRYAFGREIPIQVYEELSGQVVHYAAGLPVTIKVLGSFLCGKNKSEWIDTLERLKTIPLKETLKKLELSYHSLEDDYKEICLNVACILKGWSKDEAIQALESCGFHAINGLRVLEQKSLITTYGNSCGEHVGMHDHIEEMGRNIARRSHPDTPKKHSRLWIDEEIKDLLANDLGTKATRYFRFCLGKVNLEFFMKGLIKMTELRLLYVFPDICNSFERERKYENNQYFPDALQYLHWRKYPFWSLPNTFQGNNLVGLKMVESNLVQLWEGEERKVLNKLKFLDLSHSKLTTLDLELIPNLEALSLRRCDYLVQLTMPVGCLKLTYLDCSQSKLRALDIRLALNLEMLILNECCDLVKLNMPGKCLKLRSLELTESKLDTLDIGVTPKLKYLNLTNCHDLKKLHMADVCHKLTSLTISHSKLRTLNLRLTPKLEKLHLEQCNNLVKLRAPTGCLENLLYLYLSGCLRFTNFLFDKKDDTSCSKDESLEFGPLAELDLTVKSLVNCQFHPDNDLPAFQFKCIYYGNLPSLTRNLETLLSLGLCACTNLEMFSQSICRLQRLGTLKLKCYPEALKDLDQLECLEYLELSHTMIVPDSICMLKHLKSLKLESCWPLKKLPENLGRLDCLEELRLTFTKIEHLPDSICTLKHLKSLVLEYCFLLEKLPEDLGRIDSLQELRLSFTKIKNLPDSICMLKHLKVLELGECKLLEKLPEDLGRLESLEKLRLSCKKIKHIPDSICMLKHLKSLQLESCWLLEKLPEDLGRLDCLEELILSCKKIKHIPDSICMLKHLKSLDLIECKLLEKLPEDLGRLEFLEKLTLSSKKIKHLPDSICMLKHLESLLLQSCSLLEKLPEGLDGLESLEDLDLSGCELLGDIPDSICKMKCLKWLHIDGTCINRLPQNIRSLKGLRIVWSRGHLQSCGFTSGIHKYTEDSYYVVV